MSSPPYQIIDEPAPGRMARFIVDPTWPLLACMMAGGLPGLLWLVFNAFALGSPTRLRESFLCFLGVVGALLIYVSIDMASDAGLISREVVSYIVLLAIICKLGFAYMACFLQQRAMEIHNYYGGGKQNGLIPLLVAVFLLRPTVAALTKDWPLLWVAL